MLETDDNSTFFNANEAQNDSEHTEERAGKAKRQVTSELTKFSTRLSNDNDSDDSVECSIAVSGGKLKTVSSVDDDNDDSSSDKVTVKETNVKTRKSMRDDKGFERRLKETHITQSERKLTPG